MSDEQMNTNTNPTTNGAETATTDLTSYSVEELVERIAQLEKDVAEYKDQWLRAAADYKNFKRRAEQERIEIISRASSSLLLKLLPVMDDMERAISSVTPEIANTPWYGGFRLIPQKLQMILESEGVTPIEAVGQEFDPNLHEAVIYEEGGEGEANTVSAELQKGYKLRDRVLRPTMVKVSQG
jgi:molecular chaperone GrpE